VSRSKGESVDLEVLKIEITHCTDKTFAETFRADLAECKSEAIILSPFISTRARDYLPTFAQMAATGINVEVYSKPMGEQPPNLIQHFRSLEFNLGQSGAHFYVRPGMHEKAAILDECVLWHGSLNILSHNDTRESMLRFDLPELARQVLAEFDLKRRSDPDDRSLGTAGVASGVESPPCPECGGAMRAYDAAGLWLCQNGPNCTGSLPLGAPFSTGLGDTSLDRKLEIACPVCGSAMKISRGVFLRVACEAEDCGFALDPRIAGSLLRVLKRRSEIQ
jgi:hypothetical protein